MSRKPALAVLVLVLALGAPACGKSEKHPEAEPTPTVTTAPTATSSATDQPTTGSTPTSPAAGLPSDFPAQSEVPLVPGVVTQKDSGTQSNGMVGWVIELESVGTRKGCFDRAAAALVGAGFTKQNQLTAGDTLQAQFTTSKWAVVISASRDGDNCRLGYEVGQLSR